MHKKIKNCLKCYPLLVSLHRFKIRATRWLSDVRSAFLSRSTKLKMTPYGFKLKGSNSIHHLSMQKGTFEPKEIILFQDIIKRTDAFVDVGANIGFYSCLARQAAKYVIAVEPLQKNLAYLYANVLANDWKDVEIFPVGLAEYPRIATFFGGSSTGASLISNWAGASQMFQQMVPLSTLDIILGSRFLGKKVFIKIDIEGAEYSALLGAVGAMDMQPKPTWVVEICLNEYHPEGMNPNFQDTFKLFYQHGYEARTADTNNKLIQLVDVERWVKNKRCESGTINYKFTSKV